MTTEQTIAALAVAATILVGLAGVGGALGGVWLTARLTGRQEAATALRDLRMVLYFDATNYARQREATMNMLTIEPLHRGRVWDPYPPEDEQTVHEINTRMRILAPKPVALAWRQLLLADSVVCQAVWGILADDGQPYIEQGHPDITAVTEAVDQLAAAIRAAVGADQHR
ncbi:hypothetical protein [Polymorphospora sp. NPDC050346]|uniref:hypothetical protein n=1 Tax=Polymorphospora sp. NPDC050346 TaxID=3155780 RepID=UPI0033EAFAB9